MNYNKSYSAKIFLDFCQSESDFLIHHQLKMNTNNIAPKKQLGKLLWKKWFIIPAGVAIILFAMVSTFHLFNNPPFNPIQSRERGSLPINIAGENQSTNVADGQSTEVIFKGYQPSAVSVIQGVRGVPDRLIIPAIALDAPVEPIYASIVPLGGAEFLEYVAPNKSAAGWHVGSAELGEPGNTVLSGHHNAFGAVFANLYQLKAGDAIRLLSHGEVFEYLVSQKLILSEKNQPLNVRSDNARWIRQSDDERVTLVTCWPNNSNTHRLIIVAVPKASVTSHTDSGGITSTPLIPTLVKPVESSPAKSEVTPIPIALTQPASDKDKCHYRIAFTAPGPGDLYEIKTMKADGTDIQNLTNHPAIDMDPAWSPDGGQIAFASKRGADSSPTFNIYIMNADGSALIQLTKDLGNCRHPAWSPDGKMIAFDYELNRQSWIGIIHVDGSGFRQLETDFSWNSAPSWSPNGERIAFASALWDEKMQKTVNRDIYLINADGSGITKLTTSLADDDSPAWSPDGKMLAFVSTRKGSADIYLVDLQSLIARQLTIDAPSREDHPAWSADGKTIAFESDRDNRFGDIYTIPVQGGSWQRLTNSPDHSCAWQPAWSRVCH